MLERADMLAKFVLEFTLSRMKLSDNTELMSRSRLPREIQ
jgi:hypothetical protein